MVGRRPFAAGAVAADVVLWLRLELEAAPDEDVAEAAGDTTAGDEG